MVKQASSVDEIVSLMSFTIETNKTSMKKEWEDDATFHGNPYQVKYSKIFWHEQFIGLLAIFEKKNRIIQSTSTIIMQNTL